MMGPGRNTPSTSTVLFKISCGILGNRRATEDHKRVRIKNMPTARPWERFQHSGVTLRTS